MNPAQLYVLIVGDDAGDSRAVASALQALPGGIWHHRVAGEAALRDALRTYRPDVILCDADVPGFGGREALAIVAELAPHVPCVCIADADRGLPGGAEVVPKDRLDALAPAIRRVLASADA